ncbi:phosphoglycolate phosphatase [Chelativorans sp. AA-79]|uniref:phosphoglycolate phosphatase n=1 Tax=Chelativorans sp. AA-79 TaxID=3028735 RepID=UPI0023F64121|nr:phosphoglycolate phosphatase [Chelativorans sp. AA-79]WEX11567.1 phosphoglycolate phosphatase [Chelativorans sp. AA-79]
MTRPILVFDLDGTLVDTAPDLLASLNHCLRTVDVPEVADGEIRRYVGSGSRAMIERAFAAHGRPTKAEELDALQRLFIEHYTAGMPGLSQPFPGVRAALSRFGETGFAMAVCTNKLEGLSRTLLEALSMTEWFEAICGADTFAHRKPDPRHLVDTIERAGGDRDRAVMVGDSRTDIDTAKAAGIPVVAVDFGYTDRPVHEFEPSIVISHFDDLTLELADNLIKSAAGQPAA